GLGFTLFTPHITGAQTNIDYSYLEAFGPGFYTADGTAYRSASGKPGPAYWQNAASYTIKASLDDKLDKIKGSLIVTYTNNSPEELDFVWFQLDQNLFNSKSRGQAIVPLTESRYGSAGNNFEGGYVLQNLKIDNEATTNYVITDTRMRINLPKTISAKCIKINFT